MVWGNVQYEATLNRPEGQTALTIINSLRYTYYSSVMERFIVGYSRLWFLLLCFGLLFLYFSVNINGFLWFALLFGLLLFLHSDQNKLGRTLFYIAYFIANLYLFITTYVTFQYQVWYFEESCMVLWRGLRGTLKRAVWYFEEGCMVLLILSYGTLKRVVWYV